MKNKLPNIKERVLYLAENVEVSKQKFFEKIGITYGNFTGEKKKRPLNSDAIGNILLNYPQANPEWLLTGAGTMLRRSVQEKEESVVNTNILEVEKAKCKQKIELLQQENEFLKENSNQLKENITLLKSIIKDKEQIIALKDKEIAELQKKDMHITQAYYAAEPEMEYNKH